MTTGIQCECNDAKIFILNDGPEYRSVHKRTKAESNNISRLNFQAIADLRRLQFKD